MGFKKRGRFEKTTLIENRKGELTTKQLVTIIILIVSFVVILFLFLRLNLGDLTNKEICRNSVLMQERSALFSGPLDCRTNYMCVSGGGSCEGITATTTETADSNNKEEIMNVLAEEMADCWWMFGEGKLNYVDRDILGKASCSICSIVKFDEDLGETILTHKDLYEYLKSTPKTTSQTYLQYLYGTNDLQNLPTEEIFENYLEHTIYSDRIYFVLTGMSRQIFMGGNHLPVVIMEASSENYKAIGCDEFITKA